MNRISLMFPGLLRSYVFNHFDELSVNDFFTIAKKINIPRGFICKNNVLSSSSDVLYYMLNHNPKTFAEFNCSAYSKRCLSKLASLDVDITPDILDSFPVFLENSKILNKVITFYPSVVEKLDSSKITNHIIWILNRRNYVPSECLFDRAPILLESNELMERCIKLKPDLIIKVINPNDRLVKIALDSGYIPKRVDFSTNSSFLKKQKLLYKAFESDPSMIVLFTMKMINLDVIKSARNRGFIATEKDLYNNRDLGNFNTIMNDAIRVNPKLVLYATPYCKLDYFILEDALNKYKVTKSDLKQYPNITKNDTIMFFLKEYKLYSPFIDEKTKIDKIVDTLKVSKSIDGDSLPFLDVRFGSRVSVKKLDILLKVLDIFVDDDSVIYQQGCMNKLEYLINAIINIRYFRNKKTFKYTSVVDINDSLLNLFREYSSTNDYSLVSKYVSDLFVFCGCLIPFSELKNDVDNFYKLYVSNKEELVVSSDFSNNVLNQHRNYFSMNERKSIIAFLERKLNLNSKKKETILNGRKLDRVTKFIIDGNFTSLGISIDGFLFDLESVGTSLLVSKKLKKFGVLIDIDNINYFISIFKCNGSLDFDVVNGVVNNEDGAKFIVKSFEQVKFKYINNISLDSAQSFVSYKEKSKLCFNYNYYLIGENDRYLNNIAKILINIDDCSTGRILNSKFNKEVITLLPFVGLFNEFDINTFINVLCEFDRVIEQLSISSDNYLEKFDEVINLSNAYCSINDVSLMALGTDVVSVLGKVHVNEYLDFYKKMLYRVVGFIPLVKIDSTEYHLESGFYGDEFRLLIGRIPMRSCIDLNNSAGTKTYSEVLLESSGDVILIRDKDYKLVSRLFLFRRGNVVQIVSPLSSRVSNDIYKLIGDQLINESIKCGDNLDYVFVNKYSVNDSMGFLNVHDARFASAFAHADTCGDGVLFSSKSGDVSGIDFKVSPICSYIKPRRKISYSPNINDINKLRSLRIVLENDSLIREELTNCFALFNINEFVKVVSGEDWYLAIKEDGSFEEVVLPLNDSRAIDEIESVKIDLGLLNNNCLKLYK